MLGCLASATVKSYAVGRRAFAKVGRTIDGKHPLIRCYPSTDCSTQPQLVWNRSEQLLRCGAQGARRCHRSSGYRCPLWPFIRWMVDLRLSATFDLSIQRHWTPHIGHFLLDTPSSVIWDIMFKFIY